MERVKSYLKSHRLVIIVILISLFAIDLINKNHFVVDMEFGTEIITIIPNDFTIFILSFLVGFIYIYFVSLTTRLQRQVNMLVRNIQKNKDLCQSCNNADEYYPKPLN